MNRETKIKKLANAVRAYRGAYNSQTGVWHNQPQPARLQDIENWLAKLYLDPAFHLPMINGFKTYDAFNSWLKMIR